MSGPVADVLVLFGITGDLSRKMVLPALYRLTERGELTVPVVGVSRSARDRDEVRAMVAASVKAAFGHGGDGGDGVDEAALTSLLDRVEAVAGDYADQATFDTLAGRLREIVGAHAFAVHYLAVPPAQFGPIADGLAAAGLADRGRLVVEKPFGHDLASARALDDRLRQDFVEDDLFRVDHYLGKEPVEDLLVLRFANTLLEPLWNRSWVQRIEITMAEEFDVADRGAFYDAVGTVRDVVQNHLLQVLAYLTMDAPDSEAADDQRDAKHRLLRAVRPVDPSELVRGQYDGYRRTPGVAADSVTETFVALTLHVDNWRWAGVPIYLRAGKVMPATLLDVVLVLQAPPRMLFCGPGRQQPPPNRIRLRLQPDAGFTFSVLAKQPGHGDVATEIPISVDFRTALGPVREPYERVLADALAGDPTHFARMDNLEQAWRIVGPALTTTTPLPYPPGSWGPAAADTLVGPGGWQSLPDPRPRRSS